MATNNFILTSFVVLVGIQSLSSSCTDPTWSVLIPGEAMLVALLNLHGGGDSQCARLNTEAVEVLQALRWTVERVNEADLTRDVKIGLLAYDSCSDTNTAIYRVVDALASLQFPACESEGKFVLGVILPNDVEISNVLVRALDPLSLPLISLIQGPSGVSVVNAADHKSFNKMEVLGELLRKLTWAQVSVLYSYDEENHGNARELSSQNGHCFTALSPIPATDDKLRDLLLQLPSSGVVVLGSPRQAQRILRLSEQLNLGLSLLFADGIGLEELNEQTSAGAFVLREMAASAIPELGENLQKKLDTEPLLAEYSAVVKQRCHQPNCLTTESIFEVTIERAILSIYAVSSALKDALKIACPNSLSGCPAFKSMASAQWLQILRKANYRLRFEDIHSLQNRIASFPITKAPTFHLLQFQRNNTSLTWGMKKVAVFRETRFDVWHHELRSYSDGGREVAFRTYPCGAFPVIKDQSPEVTPDVKPVAPLPSVTSGAIEESNDIKSIQPEVEIRPPTPPPPFWEFPAWISPVRPTYSWDDYVPENPTPSSTLSEIDLAILAAVTIVVLALASLGAFTVYRTTSWRRTRRSDSS